MPDKITIQRRPNHRIGVFVDVQNLYHSAKNLYHARVNFNELFKLAVDGREVVRAVAYVVKSDTPEEKAFFDALEKSGFELKVKDLQVFAGGQKKADWDVGLAIDAISLSKQVDVVVIISGDGGWAGIDRQVAQSTAIATKAVNDAGADGSLALLGISTGTARSPDRSTARVISRSTPCSVTSRRGCPRVSSIARRPSKRRPGRSTPVTSARSTWIRTWDWGWSNSSIKLLMVGKNNGLAEINRVLLNCSGTTAASRSSICWAVLATSAPRTCVTRWRS